MTTPTRHVEREVKLSVAIGADLPDLRQVVTRSVRQPEEHLTAVYFDTPDMRLWSRGITLRHRTGEGVPRWTLKLPQAGHGDALERVEFEWAGDDEQEMPAEIGDAVAGIVRRSPLRRIAELRTERIHFQLEDDGVAWGDLVSDVVTVVGGPGDGRRFRQLELEITADGAGVDKQAKGVVKALRKSGAYLDPRPKVEAVFGPRPEDGPDLGPKSSAQQVICQALASGLGRLLDHDCRIRLAGADVDPEDVHQQRVASRRLRSDLATLAPLLDPVWVGHVRRELRQVGAVLGAVRDIDVLTDDLARAGAAEDLIHRLERERASAVCALREMLTGSNYLDLLDRLHAASERPPIVDRKAAGRPARRVVPPLVAGRWKKLRRDAAKGGKRPGDRQLHQIRKRSKQLRYASELAAPVAGKGARRTAKASKSVQSVLGDHHDAVVAVDWLSDVADGTATVSAASVRRLTERENRRKRELERRWRAPYQRLGRPASTRWLKVGH
ncbi:MAG TPA: CYTH and CHAD domain-containing protein [Acidimicrobiales bacterium]|jgi:CHAD domain-containing protein|nr:CYTH and CHAD domain-containing protein [Acidimicrobiales bacterium]